MSIIKTMIGKIFPSDEFVELSYFRLGELNQWEQKEVKAYSGLVKSYD